MTADKPSTHPSIQRENDRPAKDPSKDPSRDPARGAAEERDIFHPDDREIADNRLEATIENTHVSADLKVEKLVYIHDMLMELKKLAASLGEPMVSYLIDMALIETSSATQVNRFSLEFRETEE